MSGYTVIKVNHRRKEGSNCSDLYMKKPPNFKKVIKDLIASNPLWGFMLGARDGHLK